MPSAADMVEALRLLVESESFTSDPEAVEACGEVLDGLCRDVLGTRSERAAAGPHRRWRRPGERPVLVLGHLDTVWPTGTLTGWPFSLEDGVARGPGVFDMKAGIVQALYAAADTQGAVTLLFTGDEEVGSPTSRSLIEEEARGARAVLVLEPAAGKAVKVARKGVGDWRVRAEGRAAHAGLDPDDGINAVLEIAHQADRIHDLADPEAGTTVAVTRIEGGHAGNVIPESAWCTVDARMWTDDEADRVARGMAALSPTVSGASLHVEGGINRRPLERASSEPLYRRLLALGYDVEAAEVGGASDGNLTAALGVPTLDGLGAVGGGAHARHEHVVVNEMPRRSEMVARLMQDLLSDG